MNWLKKILIKKFLTNNSGIFCSEISYIIGSKPQNILLFETAFTHRSLNKGTITGNALNYERLEILGDAILGSLMPAFLYNSGHTGAEGDLTQMRSKIVNRSYLNSIGKKLRLIDLIKTKANIANFGDNINGNLLEALIGAIYIDEGFTV